MSIRRQVKAGRDSISLLGLLEDIKANASEIRRSYWTDLYRDLPIATEANRHFDQVFGPEQSHLDPAIPTADATQLNESLQASEAYADNRVAHFDRGAEPSPPTFQEIDAALDLIDKLVVKYTLYLSAGNLEGCTPHIEKEWARVFDKPWRHAPPT